MLQPRSDASGKPHALRVLVVEDNWLIAETISEMLERCGCEVVGPAPDLDSGLTLLENAQLDGALLDVNLSGTMSFPVATALEARGVPFVFLTGYDAGTIFPAEFRTIRRLSKPCDQEQVADILEVWGRMSQPGSP